MCISIYMYTNIYVYVYIYVYIYMNIYTYNTCIYIYIYIYIDIYINVYGVADFLIDCEEVGHTYIYIHIYNIYLLIDRGEVDLAARRDRPRDGFIHI